MYRRLGTHMRAQIAAAARAQVSAERISRYLIGSVLRSIEEQKASERLRAAAAHTEAEGEERRHMRLAQEVSAVRREVARLGGFGSCDDFD
eukprot:SAG11_NODE_15980_length_560_cov_2.121475_1_plen_91_part_00